MPELQTTTSAIVKPQESRLLTGWAQIGRFLGVDWRTAKAWYGRGWLPVVFDQSGKPVSTDDALKPWRRTR